ncbi:MAG: hypothetical protein GQ574_13155 [Crocinitomix sp.]|nr:hypothetical protein [Crocinitomix sp.]
MNTYNENLRTSIVNSLDEQAASLQKTHSALGAQEISLYYAQGALITANDKFDATLKVYEHQQDTLGSVNENNNSVINVVDAATQEKSCVDQAVKNTAVAASNVQIAANAIVSLAGDIGNVFSIVSAADYNSQIYTETLAVKNNMDTTAYNSKLASQYAMEATMRVSSITAGTVLTEAQATGAALETLNESFKGQFEKTSATLDAENSAAGVANNLEKKAEGLTVDLNAANFGLRTGYKLSNLELNSGLTLLGGKDKPTATSFAYAFSPYMTPLYPTKNAQNEDQSAVETYYIIIVESSSKSTFSVASAETALNAGGPNKKPRFLSHDSKPLKSGVSIWGNVTIADYADSNGNDIALGTEYCLFLYVKMTDEYKKMINNYEDVLSAGSQSFELTNQLAAANFPKLNATPGSPDPKVLVVTDNKIEFKAEQAEDYLMHYRVMLLPNSSDKVGSLLSDWNLQSLKVRNEYEDKLKVLNKALANANAAIELIKGAYVQDKGESYVILLAYAQGSKDLTGVKLTTNGKATYAKLLEQYKVITKCGTSIINLAKAKTGADASRGIFFNLALAEQVPAGLFKVAAANPVMDKINYKTAKSFSVTLDEKTTDNYGNQLIPGEEYTPVVLSYSLAEATNAAQFTNALSDFANTNSFTFKLTKTKKS